MSFSFISLHNLHDIQAFYFFYYYPIIIIIYSILLSTIIFLNLTILSSLSKIREFSLFTSIFCNKKTIIPPVLQKWEWNITRQQFYYSIIVQSTLKRFLTDKYIYYNACSPNILFIHKIKIQILINIFSMWSEGRPVTPYLTFDEDCRLSSYWSPTEDHSSTQSLAIIPFWIGFVAMSFSLISRSVVALGGTSIAGEQLKKPCGCIANIKR